MTFLRLHSFAWNTAALAAAFALELAGAFRIGAAGILASLIIILLAGFFDVHWFAGFLAFFLLFLAFLLTPFWVLEVGGVALTALLLLLATPFLTGNRFGDFLILVAIGTAVVTVGGALAHGGGFPLGTLAVALPLNVGVGAAAFALLTRLRSAAHSFTL